MDTALLAILACPKCHSSLELLELPDHGGDEGLACPSCAVVYPIREGIPVLLIEEGIPRPDWDTGKRSVAKNECQGLFTL